ncbi:hypothetical protein CRUP_003703 [Coryphaenoides rupestris]|nr:hypothetical protein CRUP_003703 [Coryphaenoides rupestris]
MATLGAARRLFLTYPRITNVRQNKHIVKQCCVRAVCSGAADDTPADSHAKAQFTDAKVQDILTKITGLDIHKVFRPLQQDIKPPSYKLLTDAQLEEANEQAKEQARKLLKMPPILPERKPIDDVLSVDTILDGTDTAKYVFTDITFNILHRGVFSEDRHEDVLKLCLVQFEPDSPEYIKIHAVTFEDLDKQGKYHLLRSTRHFGGMAWYLVSAHRADGLIVDMLQRRLLQDAVSLVSLFNMVHPNSESAQDAHAQQATGTDLLKQRFIVVREPNGVLRKANWAERDRLIQVYFPKEGRKLSVPLLFNEKNLKIHAVTFEDLDKQGKYHLLRSTRHFGGMAWYLVSAHRADGLIVDMLQRRLLQDAVSLVSLFNMVHPNSESAQDAHAQQATGTDLLKIYAQKESQRSGFIELALQAHEETEDGSAASQEHA